MRLVPLGGVVALAAVLLAGCGGGGGDDQAKVQADLHRYLASLVPERSPFPVGAGTPRVKDNSCKDRHLKVVESGQTIFSRSVSVKVGMRVALWTCVVNVGTVAMPVNVVVNDRTKEVLMAVPEGGQTEVRRPSTDSDCPPQRVLDENAVAEGR